MSAYTAGSSTSVSLIQRARQFDADAWQRLCSIYTPLVYRWARVVGLQHSDAADVGQEVFATVARRIQSFDHASPGTTFRGWLKAITRNKIGDHLKRRAERDRAIGGTTAGRLMLEIPGELSDSGDGEPVFEAERSIVHRTLDAIRGDFEEATWQAFWMATAENIATDEIARRLAMSCKAVRQARYRVLRRLRSELEGAGESL